MNDTAKANVSSLDMTGEQWRKFAITFDKPNYPRLLFAGPRTVIQRLVTATATEGIILPISPPFANSSYQLQIDGPAVRCKRAPSDIETVIEKLRLEAKAKNDPAIRRPLDNRYYGFVPTFHNTSMSETNVTALDLKRIQEPNEGSNEVWMVYTNYQYGTEGMNVTFRPTVDNYTTCALHAATYTVNFNFVSGQQNITKISETLLDEIPYPHRNETKSSALERKHAYSAIMWAISDLLIGKMSTFNTSDSDGFTYNEISTQIAHTSLLGSSDLRVFFDKVRAVNATATAQTLEDIRLARNRTLVNLIEELAFNVTMSFMSSRLLSPNVLTEVARSRSIITYDYSSRNLYIAYGSAILAALIANLLGLYAFLRNKASHTRTFSARVITGRGIKFTELLDGAGERELTAPLAQEIMSMKLKFDTRIWGFVKVGKNGDEEEEIRLGRWRSER